MNYTTYNPTSGEIYTTFFGDYESIMSVIDTEYYIEGAYNSQEYYINVDTVKPVAKGDRPNTNATWDYNNKTWVANTDKDIEDARRQRNLLLLAVDRVNPIWYSTLTSEQATELATYRQALLNVPAQTGFPNTIDWPSKPSWL